MVESVYPIGWCTKLLLKQLRTPFFFSYENVYSRQWAMAYGKTGVGHEKTPQARRLEGVNSLGVSEHLFPAVLVITVEQLLTLSRGEGREAILNKFAFRPLTLANFPVAKGKVHLTIELALRAKRGMNFYHCHCYLQSVLAGLLGTR